MAEQEGISRVVASARQAVFNTRAAKGAQARVLDRVELGIENSKDLLTNDTKRPSGQPVPDRHGIRRVNGPFSAVLQPKNFAPEIAAVLRTDFEAANVAIADLTFQNGASTVTRAAGDFTTLVSDGDVIRIRRVTNTDNFIDTTVTTAAALTLTIADAPLDDTVANENARVIVSGQNHPLLTTTTSTGDGYTVSAATKTITRGAGGSQSFLSDGWRLGMVLNLPDGVAANQGKNFTITDVTATTLVVAEEISDDAGPNTTSETIIAPGAKAQFQKLSANRQKPYFTLEDRRSDMTVPESMVDHGVVYSALSIDSTPTDIYDMTFTTIGKDFKKLTTSTTPTGAPYFTNEVNLDPTIEPFGGMDLKVIFDGTPYCEVTSFSMEINNNVTGVDAFCRDDHAQTGGVARISYGRLSVSGQFTVLLESGEFYDSFDDPTTGLPRKVPITLFFQSANLDSARGSAPEFMAIHLPNAQVNGYVTDDPDGPIIVTCSFSAYERVDPAASLPTKFEQTTIFIQDSTQ